MRVQLLTGQQSRVCWSAALLVLKLAASCSDGLSMHGAAERLGGPCTALPSLPLFLIASPPLPFCILPVMACTSNPQPSMQTLPCHLLPVF